MISIEQIHLLEQKVENAVGKIAQLKAENEELRNKCTELSNTLANKNEQLNAFEQDQNKIEGCILKALDRLNSVENAVLENENRLSCENSQNGQDGEGSPIQDQQLFNEQNNNNNGQDNSSEGAQEYQQVEHNSEQPSGDGQGNNF